MLPARPRLDNEPAIVPATGIGGRLDRVETRVADRGRRKARDDPRVVGRVDRQLRFLELLVVVPGGVADRRVDSERLVRGKAVVDHLRDELALARDLHLAVDHRGDDQHVVGSQVLRLRVLHVDPLDVALELAQLLVDEVVDGGVGVELIRGRGQEALEAVGVARSVPLQVDPLRAQRRLLVVPLQPGVVGDLRDLVAGVALGDHDGRPALGRRRGQLVDRRSVAHPAGQRVRPFRDLIGLPGDREAEPEQRAPGDQGRAVGDHALALQDVAHLCGRGALGDLDHDLAVTVTSERLEHGEREPQDDRGQRRARRSRRSGRRRIASEGGRPPVVGGERRRPRPEHAPPWSAEPRSAPAPRPRPAPARARLTRPSTHPLTQPRDGRRSMPCACVRGLPSTRLARACRHRAGAARARGACARAPGAAPRERAPPDRRS